MKAGRSLDLSYRTPKILITHIRGHRFKIKTNKKIHPQPKAQSSFSFFIREIFLLHMLNRSFSAALF
jgi:hypothetical protein